MVGSYISVVTEDGSQYPLRLREDGAWDLSIPEGGAAVLLRVDETTWMVDDGTRSARGPLLRVLSALAPSHDTWVAGVFDVILPPEGVRAA